MLDKCLYDLVLVWHVSDHVGHVVFGGSHKSWTKNYREVSWFHLEQRMLLKDISIFLKKVGLNSHRVFGILFLKGSFDEKELKEER